MRCNTLLFLVFAAVSAPSLAAPLNFADDSLVARDALFAGVEARELANFAVRDYDDEDASGSMALPPGTIMRGPTQSVPSTVPGSKLPFPFVYKTPVFRLPNIASAPPLQTRELHELLLRAMDEDESGAGLFGGGSNNRRDLDGMYELLARAAEEDDESGAGIFGTIARIGGHLFSSLLGGGGSQPQQQPARRDLDAVYELLARAIEDDESGAFLNLPYYNKELALNVLKDIRGAGSSPQVSRRDVDNAIYELLARAADDDESGAGLLDFLRNIF